ncbi:MAG: NUDIX domain-containing protein [Nitrospirota bacterium]|jgi:isopentenyl-diphosphate delta-isomerase type 1
MRTPGEYEGEEFLEIVDEQGNVLGTAPREEIHGNPELLHRVVHVLVFNRTGELLLQKRSLRKDVAPGQWDTSVGGHVEPGEDVYDAARREMREELGADCPELEYLYSYIHANPYESELVYTFACTFDGAITFNRDEIQEIRTWKIGDILEAVDRPPAPGREEAAFSDNFRHELRMYLKSRT